jgi:hypothetical protein
VIVVYHTIDRGFNLAGVIIEMIRYIINTININPVCKSRSSHQYCSVFGVSCFDIVDISIQKCYTGATCAMYCVRVWEGFIFRTPCGLMFPDHCHSGDWCHVKRVNRVVYSFFAADSSPFNTLSMSRMAAAQSLLGPSLFPLISTTPMAAAQSLCCYHRDVPAHPNPRPLRQSPDGPTACLTPTCRMRQRISQHSPFPTSHDASTSRGRPSVSPPS